MSKISDNRKDYKKDQIKMSKLSELCKDCNKDSNEDCNKDRKCHKCICAKILQVEKIVSSTGGPIDINLGNINSGPINTSALFINNRLFPTSIIPIVINDTVVITNGTGLYALGKSFTGTVTFDNCQSLSLNLVNQVLTGSIIIRNSNQIVLFEGSVNNPNGISVDIKDSTDIVITNLNISDTQRGIECLNVEDLTIGGLYIENISDLAIYLENTNIMIFFNITIRNIRTYTNKSLIDIVGCQGLFYNKIFFNDISCNTLKGENKNMISLTNSTFDVKMTEISILRVQFFASADVEVNHIYTENSGSMILSDFIIDANYLNTTGPINAKHSCIKMKDCNNMFGEKCLITDNAITSDPDAVSLKMHSINIDNVFDLSLENFAINGTFISGGENSNIKEVRGFYGELGGNWVISGFLLNSQYFDKGTNGTCYGLEIKDVTLSIRIKHCVSNNNGFFTDKIYPDQCGGFIAGGKEDSNITFIECCSNSNTGGTFTTSFTSDYNNTEIINCESNGNFSNTPNGSVISFLIPGNHQIQKNVLLRECISNNFETNVNSYGAIIGSLFGVQNLKVLNCGFINNHYGIYLNAINDSSVISCSVNFNYYGIYLIDSHNVLVKDNTSQANTIGYTDNTPNIYINNKSINDKTTTYNLTGFEISLFRLNKVTGKYAYISGEPILGIYSNIEVLN